MLGDECISGAVPHALQESHGTGASSASVIEGQASSSTERTPRHLSSLPPLPGHRDVPGHGVEVVATQRHQGGDAGVVGLAERGVSAGQHKRAQGGA